MSDSSNSDGVSLQAAVEGARLDFTAATINTLSYGVYLVVALMGIHRLLQRKRGWQNISLVYSVIMFIITTAWFITNNMSNEHTLVEELYNPAGYDSYCSKTNIAAVALNSLQIIGSDLLLIYRAYVICEFQNLPVLLPFGGWLAYIGLSVVANLSCTSLFAGIQHVDKIVIAYYSLTAGCTMYCTLLICSKLLWHQRMLGQFGVSSNTDYINMSAIMAESGLFYSVASIVNAVLLVSQNPKSAVASAVFIGLSYITQAQIILRIALGVDMKANANRFNTVSNVVFGNPRSGRNTHDTGTTAHTSGIWRDKIDKDSSTVEHIEMV